MGALHATSSAIGAHSRNPSNGGGFTLFDRVAYCLFDNWMTGDRFSSSLESL